MFPEGKLRKVSSTETGVIFGNIVYDGSSANDSHYVILSDIHIDIMNYIKPSTCKESEFRQMWASFEWENKVSIFAKNMYVLPQLSDIKK